MWIVFKRKKEIQFKKWHIYIHILIFIDDNFKLSHFIETSLKCETQHVKKLYINFQNELIKVHYN